MLTETHIGSSYQRGGYIALRYTPLEHIDYYLFAQSEGVFAGKLDIGRSTLSNVPFPFLKTAERQWSSTIKKGKSGQLTENLVTGVLKDVTPVVLAELDDMAARDFVLTLETPDKTTWLIGTPEYPAFFSYSIEGRGNGNDLSRVRFRFESRLTHILTKILI